MSAGKFGQEGIGVRGEQKRVGSDALRRDGASAEKDTVVVFASPPRPPPHPGTSPEGRELEKA